MPFVVRSSDTDKPESPEALFRSLRPADRNVRDLLLRQGDALRAYAALSPKEPDVAVELPTGGGKTLVGLLIAEWRRRTFNQRVAYLCPTVQLARQVAAKAESYGIDVVTLVRAQADWDDADFTRFQRGKVIAIAGYHQVFNSNPRLDAAQTLILDDAHAAEDAVASNWSINAKPGTELFAALTQAFLPYLPSGLASRMDEAADPAIANDVALVPIEAMADVAAEVHDALSEFAVDRRDPNTYTKKMLGSAIGRCMAYVSRTHILIRPLIPPTAEHAPFAGAQQRVYMSATLGSAGELQRAFGVPGIKTVSAGAEDDPGFGRRFFVMPGIARVDADDVTARAIEEARRAVILAPSDHEANAAREALVPSETPVVQGAEVESDFSPFVDQERAVLLLSNRYDGIDLPDDACRLLVLSGLPGFAHLQERFIMDSLGAKRVLSERIRTRIQQGAGRATRNARDFAAVILRGHPLGDFLARDEERQAMPPQLQAEIEFGFDNSEEPDVDLLGLLKSFWMQDADWQAAESVLQTETAKRQRMPSDTDRALADSAEKEVLCWRAVFVDDLARAVQLAQEVTDRLIGGSELRPYRALWFYLASSWAYLLAREDPDRWLVQAKELQREAYACSTPLRWTPQWIGEQAGPPIKATLDARGERAATLMRRLGIRGGRFDAHLESTTAKLSTDEASEFEDGLERLGALLGFEAIRPSGEPAAPDGAWRDGDRVWILTEAKTEERADTPLSADTVRQAGSHEDWIANVKGWERPAEVMTVIVSHKSTVDTVAAPLAKELRWCAPSVILDISQRTFDAIRQVRARARALDDDEQAEALSKAFAEHRLDTPALLAELGARRVADG